MIISWYDLWVRIIRRYIVPKKAIAGFLLSVGLSGVQAGTMGNIEPAPDFSGFYAGLGTGMLTLLSSNDYSVGFSPAIRPPVSGHADFTDSAVLFDGHLGYGKMFNQRTYLGAKASVQYTPLKYTLDAPFSSVTGPLLRVGDAQDTFSLKPIYNINAVLGYKILPRLLPFVEAGVTFANVETRYITAITQSNLLTGVNTGYSSVLNSNKYTTGGNVGIGANYLVNKNWFLSSELIYSYLGRATVNSSVAIPSISSLEAHSRTKTNQAVSLLASISYLF